ncbi:RDD family protein [Dermabacteraceae bacterium TAE3-ERU27]|nr:RDD family protein [Dermabacteraceae bacterium TAE3-ERU27]
MPALPSQRAIAYLIDALAVLSPLGIGALLSLKLGASYAAFAVLLGALLSVVALLVSWWLEANEGYTLGKWFGGLRTVSCYPSGEEEAVPIGLWRTAGRFLILHVGHPLCGIVACSVLMSPRGWHDRLYGTQVLDVRAGYNPLELDLMNLADPVPAHEPGQSLNAWLVPAKDAAGTGESYEELQGQPATTTAGAVANESVAEQDSVQTASGGAAAHWERVLPGISEHARPAKDMRGSARGGGSHRRAPQGPMIPAEYALLAPQSCAAEEEEPTRTIAPPLRIVYGGKSRELPNRCVLGRNPNYAGAAPVVITDSGRSVSKNHLLIEREGDGLAITDIGSTNGTALLDTGSRKNRLKPHRKYRVQVPAQLMLGQSTVRLEARLETNQETNP